MSDAIAGSALLVSAISLILSWRSFSHSRRDERQQAANLCAFAKGQLLALISDCKATLNATRVEIGALKAVYDAEPKEVKDLLVNFISLFTEYLPSIERVLSLVESSRASVAEWNESIALDVLEREKARYYDDLRSFQFAGSQATSLIATFREKLELARIAVKNQS